MRFWTNPGANSHKTAVLRPPAFHPINYPSKMIRHAGYCKGSKDEHISDILSEIPTPGCTSVGRPVDTGCCLEDLLGVIDDRDGWWERERERERERESRGTSRCEHDLMMMMMMINYYFYSLVFHISVSRWFFTGVWVTASLFKSPGLVLGFSLEAI